MRPVSIFLRCALVAPLILSGCNVAATAVPTTPTTAPVIENSPTASSSPTAASSSTPAESPTGASIPPLGEMPQQLIWLADPSPAFGVTEPGPVLETRIGKMLYGYQPDPLRALPPVTLPVPEDIITLAPDLKSAIAGSPGGPMSVYDLTGKQLFTIDEPNPYYITYTADGKTITLNGTDTWSIIVYDAATGERLNKLTGFETAAPVYSGGLAPGGKTAYWIARATLRLQDVESGQMGTEFSYQDFIESFAFSPDGSRLAISVSEKIYLYSVPDGKELAQLTRSQPANSLQFSPDGSLLASGYGPSVQVWNGNTLSPVTSFPGPNEFTGLVTFSPDGKYLAAAHEGGQITIERLKN